MSDTVRMGTKELRDQIGRRVDAAHFLHEPTVITRNGKPRAVMISYEEWEGWKERERTERATA